MRKAPLKPTVEFRAFDIIFELLINLMAGQQATIRLAMEYFALTEKEEKEFMEDYDELVASIAPSLIQNLSDKLLKLKKATQKASRSKI